MAAKYFWLLFGFYVSFCFRFNKCPKSFWSFLWITRSIRLSFISNICVSVCSFLSWIYCFILSLNARINSVAEPKTKTHTIIYDPPPYRVSRKAFLFGKTVLYLPKCVRSFSFQKILHWPMFIHTKIRLELIICLDAAWEQ